MLFFMKYIYRGQPIRFCIEGCKKKPETNVPGFFFSRIYISLYAEKNINFPEQRNEFIVNI